VLARDTQQAGPDATPARAPGRIQSIDRAAALLRAVAAATGPQASASALAETVGLNRTTTWRILSTLEQQRLVAFDRTSGWYSLGFELIDLAGQAVSKSLAQSARAVLHQVAAQTGETAALAVMRDGGLTYVAEATAGAVVSAGWLDRQVSMHATSTGKVFLAHSDRADLRSLLRLRRGGRLPRYTPSTITSLSRLNEELALIRESGFAACRGEFESSAWGVSAPVLDLAGRPVAVISVWGPSERLTEDRFEALGAIAIAGAAEIAGRQTPAPARVMANDAVPSKVSG
jgi:DNA-binding IclR family transcriptional regulator